MFGYAAFAQSPYAALGGKAPIPLSIVEGMTVADLSTQASAFIQSFTDGSTLADTITRDVTFPFFVVEDVTSGDFNTQYTAYKPTVVENVSMGENTLTTGWRIVLTNEDVVWTLINTSS